MVDKAATAMSNSANQTEPDADQLKSTEPKNVTEKSVQVNFSIYKRHSVGGGRFAPPLRKQSSGDLQSRLKTRKLLGVGENEDGSVPVSKISQILGGDDNFLFAFPAGLKLWQVTTSFVFTLVSIMAIIFPSKLVVLYSSSLECESANVYPIMFFGASLACLAVLFWSSVHSPSRHVIRWTLIAQIVYFTLQTLVLLSMIWELRAFSFLNALIMAFHLLLTSISLLYYLKIIGYRFWAGRRTPFDNCDKTE